MLIGRNRSSHRDWNHGSESDGSGDEISVSTESGKEDKKADAGRASKSRSHFKKLEKEERNKETRKNEGSDSKPGFQSAGSGGPRFERKGDFSGNSREGFAPRGEPSRRGRGSMRMSSNLGRRLDGYGPPPSKSPFSRNEDKKTAPPPGEKSTEGLGEGFGGIEDDKTKQKQQALTASISGTGTRNSGKGGQIGPRMQKKSENDQR